MKIKTDISELFDKSKLDKTYLKVCAPMVRYSKVHFRTLVRNFGVDLSFTPMILADSFCQHSKARASEFTTTINDSPVIVQFAANNENDFIDASKLVYPYADGVDLNCGCPQRWAMKDGYGCALLSKPEVIQNLVKSVRNNLTLDFSVSVKIRILKDLKCTIDMCRQLEKCGLTFLTVHGRTPTQKPGDNIDVDALKEVCKSISIPVIANGGIKTLSDADNLHGAINCGGVMAASGILTNPALFSGVNQTPINCIKLWMDLKDKSQDNITFQCYHHHLVFMLDKILSKRDKQVFNYLNTFESVDEYLNMNVLNDNNTKLSVMHNLDEFITCSYPEEITLKHSTKCRGCGKSLCYCICINYDYSNTQGSFFATYVKEDSLDYMDCNIFDETT